MTVSEMVSDAKRRPERKTNKKKQNSMVCAAI